MCVLSFFATFATQGAICHLGTCPAESDTKSWAFFATLASLSNQRAEGCVFGWFDGFLASSGAGVVEFRTWGHPYIDNRQRDL
jgi:hypothetical protein